MSDNPFGFERPPFHVTPDSSMIFAHRRYEEALAALEYGIEAGKGFIVITGEVGAGKTTLIRHYLARVGDRLRSAVVFNTGLSPDELLAAIAEDLGAPPIELPATRKRLIDAINAILIEEFEARRGVVIFIDEAQNLPIESLEILRMLSNLETETEKLLQIVLIGQPELQEILARPDLAQLRSRVAVTYHLQPMSEEETGAYIAHRIAEAHPARPVVFAPKAVRRIHRYADGVPRLINILADQSLVAADPDAGTIGVGAVEAAIESFEHLDPPPAPGLFRGLAFAALSFAVVLSLVYAVLSINGRNAVFHFPQRSVPGVFSPEATSSPEPAVAGLLRLMSAPAIPGVSTMTLEAVARISEMTVIPVTFEADAVQALGLPALVLPGNRILTNAAPVLVSRVESGVWTIEGMEEGRLHLPIARVPVPLNYLVPTRPWMARVTRRGMRGPDIEAAQKILKRAGFLVNEPNGYFGVGTTAAVATIQARLGVDEGPTIGPATMLGIFALENK
jgi:type II secretory pathway predicted ATPase ExeA